MEINLETEKDFITFVTSGKTLLEELEPNSKVTINPELLATVVNDYERKIKGYENRIDILRNHLEFEKFNSVVTWIDIQTDIIEDESEEEIRKNCLKSIKEELSKLKSEKDLTSVNWSNYNFLDMLNAYDFEPEAIIDKVERDLAEIEA